MNKKAFLIFIIFFFGIYSLLNYYVYYRGWQCLSDSGGHYLYNVIFGILFFSFFIGKFLERTHLFRFSRPIIFLSSVWLGALLYFFLIIIFVDMVRLLDFFISFLPESIYCPCSKTKELLFGSSVSLVFLILLFGFINARIPAIRNIELHIHKKTARFNHLKIVMISDIHMGILFGRKRCEYLAKRIKKLSPDLIVFAGDLIDEVPRPVIDLDMGAALRKLSAPLGKIAITGNHEYIGGVNQNAEYIRDLGITLLRDEAVILEESIILAGREDKDSKWHTKNKRKSLPEILAEVPKNLPLILIDHQPFRLEDSVLLNVDLHLSGHTHHGQLWPLNYITKAIFEKSMGYLKKGNTHFYISNGYGTWGPPLRIGNRPEIVNILLHFQNE